MKPKLHVSHLLLFHSCRFTAPSSRSAEQVFRIIKSFNPDMRNQSEGRTLAEQFRDWIIIIKRTLQTSRERAAAHSRPRGRVRKLLRSVLPRQLTCQLASLPHKSEWSSHRIPGRRCLPRSFLGKSAQLVALTSLPTEPESATSGRE
jgi:hypothetical protein